MRWRTVLLLTAAAVCAGGATLLTRMNMTTHSGKVRIEHKVVNPRTSTIVVAARDISFGKTLDKSMLQQVEWPAKLLPPGTFSKISDLVGKQGGRVVLAKITKGEPVLQAKVSKPGQRPSLSGALAETKSAVTIRVDDVQGVAGFIQPEDYVDVLLTRRLASTPAPGAQTASDPSVFTDILLQNVKVLAVDQRFVRSTSAKPARAVTLEVDQVQAQKLVLAASVGKLSLTLKNNPGAETDQPRRISLDDLPSSGRSPSVPVQVVDEKDTGPTDPVVTIVRGASKREVYRVPDERTIAPDEQIAAPKPNINRGVPSNTSTVGRDVLEPLSPPPLTGWRTRWSGDIANAAKAREKKATEEQPTVPVPQ